MEERLTGVTIDSGDGVAIKIDSSGSGWGGKVISIVSTQYKFPLPVSMKVNFYLATLSDGQPGAVGVTMVSPKLTNVFGPEISEVSDAQKPSSVFLSIAQKAERELRNIRNEKQPASKMGGGGPFHQFTQLVIKSGAENIGYIARLEQKITFKGSKKYRSVDVVIEGRGLSIACEVPVSTKYNEYGNIKKCLEHGFDLVISVSMERKTLDIVEKSLLDKLTSEEFEKVRFFTPEELFEFLQQVPVNEVRNSVVCGYNVKTTYIQTSSEERDKRRNQLARIFSKSLLRERV